MGALEVFPARGIDSLIGISPFRLCHGCVHAIGFQPDFAFMIPSCNHCPRYGISLTKCHKIGGTFLAPMREVPVIAVNGSMRIECLKFRIHISIDVCAKLKTRNEADKISTPHPVRPPMRIFGRSSHIRCECSVCNARGSDIRATS